MERDSTQDWVVPAAARPPLLSELEARVEAAADSARAAEEAVRVVGGAATEAAAQARRAAELAERASRAAERAAERAPAAAVPEPPREDPSLRRFSERADRVVARLRALERRQAHPPRRASAARGERPAPR